MDLLPLTLAQADEIADDFEDLKDSEFTLAQKVFIIDNVVVSPFAEADKESFFDYYLQTNNAKEALGTYFGVGYDVIIITCDADDESIKAYMGIRQFAKEKGIGYNFP